MLHLVLGTERPSDASQRLGVGARERRRRKKVVAAIPRNVYVRTLTERTNFTWHTFGSRRRILAYLSSLTRLTPQTERERERENDGWIGQREKRSFFVFFQRLFSFLLLRFSPRKKRTKERTRQTFSTASSLSTAARTTTTTTR